MVLLCSVIASISKLPNTVTFLYTYVRWYVIIFKINFLQYTIVQWNTGNYPELEASHRATFYKNDPIIGDRVILFFNGL